MDDVPPARQQSSDGEKEKNKSDEAPTRITSNEKTNKCSILFGRVLPAQNADCGYDDAQKSVFRQNKKTSSRISAEKFG